MTMPTVEFLGVNEHYVTPNSPNMGEYLISNGFPPDRTDVYFGYPCYALRGAMMAKVAAEIHDKGATLRYVRLGRGAAMPTKPLSLLERRDEAGDRYCELETARRNAEDAVDDFVATMERDLGLVSIDLDTSGDEPVVEVQWDNQYDPAPAESWPAWTDEVSYATTDVPSPGDRTAFARVPMGHWFSRGAESRKRLFQKASNRRAADRTEDRVAFVFVAVAFEPDSRVTYEGASRPCVSSAS